MDDRRLSNKLAAWIAGTIGARVWMVDAAGAVCVVAIAAGMFVVGVGPALAERARADRLRIELAERERVASEVSARHAEMSRRVETAQELLASGEPALAPVGSVNRLLLELTELFADESVEFVGIDAGTAQLAEAGVSVVSVRVDARGTFPDLVRALAAVQRERPNIRVRGLGVTGGADGALMIALDLVWSSSSSAATMKKGA